MQFVDNQGREYHLSLTLRRARDAAERIGIDIFNPNDWDQLCTSLAVRLAYVYLLVKDQADSYDLDADRFELALQGKGIATGASDALEQVVTDFFRAYDAEEMALLNERRTAARKAAREMARSPEFLAKVDKQLATAAKSLGSGGEI